MCNYLGRQVVKDIRVNVGRPSTQLKQTTVLRRPHLAGSAYHVAEEPSGKGSLATFETVRSRITGQ